LLLIFMFFTASGSRRNYYILPILPYCVLIAAHYLHDPPYARTRTAVLYATFGLLIFILSIALSLPLVGELLQQRCGIDFPTAILWSGFFTGAVALIVAVSTAITLRRHYHWCYTAIIFGALTLFGGFFFGLQPLLDQYRSE